MDCSLPGSSAHGIFQARVLEWGAIAFSKNPLEKLFLEELTSHDRDLKCRVLTLSNCLGMWSSFFYLF